MKYLPEQLELLSNLVIAGIAGVVLADIVAVWYILRTWDDISENCIECKFRENCLDMALEERLNGGRDHRL
jgi:hypothetical protein